MQYTSIELYSETSIKNDIPLHKVKFVGDIVFNAINNNLKEPESIILKIKNIGKFYMRKNKLDSEIGYLQKLLKSDQADKLKHERKLSILLKRQEEYNEYLEEKKKIKKIRHAKQTIIPMEVPIREEEI
jgi:hypothetical protein